MSPLACRIALRIVAVSALALIVGACGPGVSAVVSGGKVTAVRYDIPPHEASGPIPFTRGTTLTAAEGGVQVRVDAGGSATARGPGDPPGAGVVDFDLDEGAQLRRRDDTAFDLITGATRIRSGAVLGRLIVMNGTCYLSAAEEDNRDGIDVRLIVHGNQMKVEVAKGRVLLNATDEEERDTIFVTLEAGDTSVAAPGEAPKRGATDWYEAESE